MVNILLIEDNEELGAILCDFLARDGYSCFQAKSGEEGLEYFNDKNVELVLLDIMLPGIDGFGVCKKIREKSNIPIIVLSAKVGKEDKISGLTLGADDYIEKPYDIDILLAKIKSQLRRNYGLDNNHLVLQDGNLVVDLEARTAYLDKTALVMTVKEFDLLVVFLKYKGKTLRKEWLFNEIWGMDSFSEPSTLTVHINKLREKIEPIPKKPVRIVTAWGIGYKYEATK